MASCTDAFFLICSLTLAGTSSVVGKKGARCVVIAQLTMLATWNGKATMGASGRSNDGAADWRQNSISFVFGSRSSPSPPPPPPPSSPVFNASKTTDGGLVQQVPPKNSLKARLTLDKSIDSIQAGSSARTSCIATTYIQHLNVVYQYLAHAEVHGWMVQVPTS